MTLAGPTVSLRMLIWEPAQEGLTILGEWVFGSEGETGVDEETQRGVDFRTADQDTAVEFKH